MVMLPPIRLPGAVAEPGEAWKTEVPKPAHKSPHRNVLRCPLPILMMRRLAVTRWRQPPPSTTNDSLMLRGIRTASSNWLGKAVLMAVMGLLIVSFAIWGIGDIFRGFGRSQVAKVGRTEISIEQFRQAYNDRLQQLGRRVGRPITSEQARAAGLDRQILGQLLAEAAMDERVRQLGLNLSSAEIARQIMSDPNFRGPNGQFDRLRFDQLIRNAGFNESRYTAEQRRVNLRRQIAETITTGVSAPKTAAEALNRFENEQRSIDFIILGREQAGELPAPTPETLRAYYEERKTSFRAPEYRRIVLLSLTPADLAQWIEVSEADLKKTYEARKARYVVPERRAVQQIVFSSEADAKTAADRVAGGLSFAELAIERKLSDKDIDLGTVTKSAMVDPTVASAAFSLQEGATSGLVKGRFGVVLVHVTKVEPEKVKTLEEVAPELKREIALERARAELLGRHDKIEDERAAGLKLSEVGPKVGLEARVVEAVDRSGRAPNGAPAPNLPRGLDVISPAFSTQIGVENDPLEIPGGGYLWYDVDSIQPSRERTFDEVASLVEERWRATQIAEALRTRAAQLVEKLKGTASIAEIANEVGVKAQSATGLKRNRSRDNLAVGTLEVVFNTDKGAAASAQGEDPTQRVVFRVIDVNVPGMDPASPEGKQQFDELRRAISDDLLAQYVARLESELGMRVNEDAVRQVVGGER